MSSTTAPCFEPLDIFDFPAESSSARLPEIGPEEDEDIDYDLEAELAKFRESEKRDKRNGFGGSPPPPDLEEEPDEWDEELALMESEQMSQSLSTTQVRSSTVTTVTSSSSKITFGESDILGQPVASCESRTP